MATSPVSAPIPARSDTGTLPVARLARAALRVGGHLADLVLPVECAGCRRPGHTWCRRCDRALADLAFAGHPGVASAAPHGLRPVPALRVAVNRAPAGLPSVHAWGAYADPLRTALPAWKDAGRRDLTPRLAPLLASALAAAVDAAGWWSGPVVVVPVPSSRASVRVRGDRPVEDLARAALPAAVAVAAAAAVAARTGPGPSLHVAGALRHTRRVRDQAGLSTAGRRRNLTGAMAVAASWQAVVRGRRCILVDDVVTTGATLSEAARALAGAGAAGVVAAAVAATPRAGPAR